MAATAGDGGPQLAAAAREAFVDAMGLAFIVAAAVALGASLMIARFMPGRNDPRGIGGDEAEGAPRATIAAGTVASSGRSRRRASGDSQPHFLLIVAGARVRPAVPGPCRRPMFSDQITSAAMVERGEPSLEDVLEKAADLQHAVPGAVLVGGAAAAFYARHRISTDHDHVVVDLALTFDTVLENLEALGDFSLARAQAGKLILGDLGGIETGVRQMMRRRPLETTTVEIRGKPLVVPTAAETLRIKAWLAVSRNQARDYLDLAALADTLGIEEAAGVLAQIDDYYGEVNRRPEAVATQVARQLADPVRGTKR